MLGRTVEDKIQKIILPLICIIFLSVLNGTMFQVAVPDISAEYRLLPSEVSWVMTGYILVFAVGSLMYGKLADIYPVKSLITTGLLLMNAGALFGLFSTQYFILIMGRLMQAAGGAAIPALAMIAATRYFPSDLKGKVLGIIASTVALAAGTGPILGGFISGTLHWRYLFLTTLLTVFAIPFLRRFIPDEKRRKHSFDTAGAVLIACSTSLLLVFVTQGRFWTLPAAVIMLALFYFHIRRTESPFVSPVLFSNRIYRNSIITTFLSIGTVFGMMFMVPIMLSDLNGLDANSIGLAVFPGAASAVIMGVIGGRLCDRKGSRLVVYTGSGLMIAGFVILSTSAGYAPWIITLELIISYAGFAFLQSALPHTISDVLSAGQTGIGMGIFNLFFFISGAFSTAGIGRVLDFRSSGFCLNPLNPHADGWIYCNIFIMLAVIVSAAVIIFHMTVARK
jgi:DHA2 family metal-tetracycline-proton antiporter-like MFS transporter